MLSGVQVTTGLSVVIIIKYASITSYQVFITIYVYGCYEILKYDKTKGVWVCSPREF